MSLEPNCRCLQEGCSAPLRAEICGPHIVLLELEARADGTHTHVAGKLHEIVPNTHRSSVYKIRAELVGARARYRDHARFCPKNVISYSAVKPTRPTGVFDRDR